MTVFQKTVKYLAMAFAIFLTVSILGGILNAVGLVGGLFGNDNVLDETKQYTVSDRVTELCIEVNAAEFAVKQADSFSVESNLKNLTVEEKDGVLTIRDTKKFTGSYNGAKLLLCIPAGTSFEKADITTGAGKVTVDFLSADVLRLEFGAGEVEIASVIANKTAHIEGGAGKISISDGSLCNLDLDMGVGQFNLTSAVLGSSEFDMGVGEANITLLGGESAYTVHAEKGIGDITVDGKSVSDSSTVGSGENRVELSGGVGAIHVDFKDS